VNRRRFKKHYSLGHRTKDYCTWNDIKTEGLKDIWSNADGQRARRADQNRVTRRPTNNSGLGTEVLKIKDKENIKDIS
jgi:hypothetical protein